MSLREHTVQKETPRRRLIVSIRFLTLVVTATMLLFNQTIHPNRENQIVIFIALYLISVLLTFVFSKSWLEKSGVLYTIFILDTAFISYGLYLNGTGDIDLYLIYFVTIFLSALTQEVKASIGVALLACFLYVFLQYRGSGHWLILDTPVLLRLPFLFAVATFSGYLASDVKERELLSEHNKEMTDAIAQQADIATRKLMESNRSLDALVEYHRRILACIKNGVIVAHQDLKIHTFNDAAVRITGCEEARVVGSRLDALPESLAPIALLMQRTLKDGKDYTQENVELVLPRSETITVSLQTMVLRGSDGAVLGAIATLKDVSLFKQMEMQLIRSEKLSALGEMAAGVAHEIKNPLNAVQGFSQRLVSKLEDPNLKKYAEIIVDEVRRMDTIINDVLEYNRTNKTVKTLGDINAVLEGSFLFLAMKLEKTGVTLVRELAEGLPPVPMDADKMKQVFMNLMINAVHAMQNGGTLTIRSRMEEGMIPAAPGIDSTDAMLQQVFLQQKMVSVMVRDTGCGIPKENLSKLFHPFFTTKAVGTGLGLSICNKIVEGHGGFIRVDSKVGEGTAFTVYMPLEA